MFDEDVYDAWDREDDLQDRMDNEAWEDAQLEMEQDEWEAEGDEAGWDEDDLELDFDMGE